MDDTLIPILPEWRTIAKREFDHYLFYRNITKSRKEAVCSCCGMKFYVHKHIDGTVSGDDFLLITATRGKSIQCPSCGVDEICQPIGIYRDMSCLEQYSNLVFFQTTASGQEVTANCFTVYCEYYDDGVEKLTFVQKAEYLFRPGEWRMMVRAMSIYGVYRDVLAVYRGSYVLRTGDWVIRKNPSEPWQGCFYNQAGYKLANMEELDRSFLKYSRINRFMDLPRLSKISEWYSHTSKKPLTFLCWYCRYPSIEIAMRTGGEQFVQELVYRNVKNHLLVNWNSNRPDRFYRLPAQEMKDFVLMEDKKIILSNYRTIKKTGTTIRELIALYRSEGTDDLKNFSEICKYVNIRFEKLRKYLNAQKHDMIYYLDYLQMASKVGRDLKVHNVALPKNLALAHDEAVRSCMFIDAEKDHKLHPKLDGKREKLFNYFENQFLIRMPVCATEIVREGNLLHHCVGGYVDRHMTGKTTILFIRTVANPEIPLYTLEYRDGGIRQCYGFKDTPVKDPNALAFIDRWLEYVNNGSMTVQRKETAS